MGSTLREALESAVSAQEAKESTIVAAPEVVPEAKAAPETPEPVTETVKTAEQHARDEKGRFAEGKTKQEKPVAAKTETKPEEVKKLPKPDSWKKDYQADWDALTPRQQEYVKAREDQYFKGISTYQQEWNGAKPLIDAIAPYMPELQANNIKPEQWISNLGKAHYTLAKGSPQEKLQMFAQLSRDYGVPLQALFDPNIAQQYVQQTVQQPARPAPQQDVASLVRQEMETARMQEQISSFESATDAAGNKLYPHYRSEERRVGKECRL